MRVSRFLPIVAAGALLAATTAPASAQEDPPDAVGTTTGVLTALGVDVAGLLQLDLLSDGGRATNDPASGVPIAQAALTALSLEQPTTGLSESLSVFSVESTGAPETAGHDGSTPIENPVVGGSVLPTLLGAAVGDEGPTSGVTTGVGNLSVLGGVLSLESTASQLGSAVRSTSADGERSLSLDALTILDLESLLAGLGIPLTDLPLDTALALLDQLGALDLLQPVLDQLGLDLETLSVDAVLGLVGDLEEGLGVLETLEGTLTGVTAPVCELTGGAEDLLGGLLGGGGGGTLICDTTDTVTEQLETVLASIDDLLAQLEALLNAPLDLLDDLALLSLEGLDVSVLTKATDDVATSAADVTATLGAIKVGENSLPVGDLLGAGTQVDAVLGQVQGLVDGVLDTVGLGLSDLIDVALLEEQTSVTEAEDGTVVSTAAFNGLRVDVLPVLGELQGVLDGVLAGLGGADSIGSTLAGLGLPVPDPLSIVPVDALAGDLGLPALQGLLAGTAALEMLDGLSLRAATLEQESTYVLSATATPNAPGAPAAPAGPSLPNTGSSDAALLLAAGLAAVGALGIRRWMLAKD